MRKPSFVYSIPFVLLGWQCVQCGKAAALSSPTPPTNRRQILIGGITSVVASSASRIANADVEETVVDLNAVNSARKKDTESVDMTKINASRANGGSSRATRAIFPIQDPPPTLAIRGGKGGKSNIKIPRVGYSFYKTSADQAERCTALALRAGVRHLDMATSYESNPEIAKALKKYLENGIGALNFDSEKPEVLQKLDETCVAADVHARTTIGSGLPSTMSPPPLGSAGRRGRREGLYLSHKISNEEQSTDPVAVRRSVKKAIETLGCSYLDMVSIHSPLTDENRRLASYQALLDLRDSGFVKSVGVCNYGLGTLEELAAANLELPAVNQLELSPFNAHSKIVEWCDKSGISISCAAWSRLSGADGPTEGWDVVSKLSQERKVTKAQILVRWALQKGYICVPRSAASSKLERIAIAENSYGGVNPQDRAFLLSDEEMKLLDSLDVSYKAGKLGRIDGWSLGDISGQDWDPTDFK